MQGASGENRVYKRAAAADGPFPANPTGGGQGTVSFVACRQCIDQYTFLLASRPGPLGLPSKRIYRCDSALGYCLNMRTSDAYGTFYPKYGRTCLGGP